MMISTIIAVPPKDYEKRNEQTYVVGTYTYALATPDLTTSVCVAENRWVGDTWHTAIKVHRNQ